MQVGEQGGISDFQGRCYSQPVQSSSHLSAGQGQDLSPSLPLTSCSMSAWGLLTNPTGIAIVPQALGAGRARDGTRPDPAALKVCRAFCRMLWGAAAAETSPAALPTPKPDAGTLGSITPSVHGASITCTTHQVVSKPCKQHFSLTIRAPRRRLSEAHRFKVGSHDAQMGQKGAGS